MLMVLFSFMSVLKDQMAFMNWNIFLFSKLSMCDSNIESKGALIVQWTCENEALLKGARINVCHNNLRLAY
jgi:hypothetical protein